VSPAAAIYRYGFRSHVDLSHGLFLHAIKGGIDRALFGAENLAGDILYGGHDRITVQPGPTTEDLQNKEIQKTLERIRFRLTEISYYKDI
jgi:hypothetical protein